MHRAGPLTPLYQKPRQVIGAARGMRQEEFGVSSGGSVGRKKSGSEDNLRCDKGSLGDGT